MSEPKIAGVDKEPRWKLFRRKRGGVALTREQVKEIKEGRKKLKKQMKEAGVYSKYEFETTASSLGLYFDKRGGLLLWFFHGRGLWALLGAMALLLAALMGMAAVSQMRGYFTINLSDATYKNGFVLSETEDFAQTSGNLFCEPAVGVHCISITSIEDTIDDYEGQHNGTGYFAYTYFLRNEGVDTVDYSWELQITGESQNISVGTWIMVIEDGVMRLYAEMTEDGLVQTLPAQDDNTRGYLNIPVMSLAAKDYIFLEPVRTVGELTYKRVITIPFEDDDTVARGSQTAVAPMDVHKYTVVVWLEGDDPECTDDLIGGHLGLNMQYTLIDEEIDNGTFWDKLWESLLFWED